MPHKGQKRLPLVPCASILVIAGFAASYQPGLPPGYQPGQKHSFGMSPFPKQTLPIPALTVCPLPRYPRRCHAIPRNAASPCPPVTGENQPSRMEIKQKNTAPFFLHQISLSPLS